MPVPKKSLFILLVFLAQIVALNSECTELEAEWETSDFQNKTDHPNCGSNALNKTTEDISQLYESVRGVLAHYIPAGILIFGIPGNVITILVLRTRPYRQSSSSWYMIGVAVADLYVLAVDGVLFICYVFYEDLFNSNRILCRSMFAVSLSAPGFTNLLLLALSVDRFILLKWPTKTGFHEARTVRIVIFIAFLIPVLFATEGFLSADIDDVCLIKNEIRFFVTNTSANVIFILLPQMVIAVVNIAIMVVLVKGEHLNVHGQDSNGRGWKKIRHDRHLTAIMLLVSWVYVALTAPDIFCVFFWFLYDPKSQTMSYEGFNLTVTVCKYLAYSNSAIKFYVSVASSQKFRTRVLQLLKLRKDGGDSTTSGISTVSSSEPSIQERGETSEERTKSNGRGSNSDLSRDMELSESHPEKRY